MEEEFVPYEEALELRELGFDEPCLGIYKKIKNKNPFKLKGVAKFEYRPNSVNSDFTVVPTAPTWGAAFRWFREKHKLFISFSRYRNSVVIEMPDTFSKVYEIWIQDENEDESVWVECFDTYEEAELACLRKLIELVKQ